MEHGKDHSGQMNLTTTSEFCREDYLIPAVEIMILQAESTLAASNTEPIDEDDDEYDWD